MDFYAGSPTWIVVTTCCGVAVGLLRVLLDYPDDTAGLFKEILTYHVDPTWAPATYFLSMVSLAGQLDLLSSQH